MAYSYLDKTGLGTLWGKIKTALSSKLDTTGDAYRTSSIPYGEVDSTSTSTVFTASVSGITELRDGVCMWLRNGVVTSASGFTININNLGAKPVYQSMAAASRSTTIFNVAYTMLFIYNSTRVSGGCWDCVYGYNTDTNTTAYQIRRNNGIYQTKNKLYRYMMLLSYSETQFIPINTTSNSTATTKTLTTEEFNPFGDIGYYNTTTAIDAGGDIPVANLWYEYAFNLAYSFNTGSTLTTNKDVFLVATPQSNGKAKLYSSPITQNLPSTDDGLIYIYLGHAYSTTNIVLSYSHPIYYYKNGKILIWTGIDVNSKADKTATVSNVVYDSTNSKLTETINGTTTDIVTVATLKTAMGLDNAEQNQNAFSNVKVGSTTVSADSSTDTLELVAGSNVTLTPDATNDKVTIAVTLPIWDGTVT